MNRAEILEKGAFRQEIFKFDGVEFVIRELTLNERRTILENREAKTEAVAAMTVAFACPEFTPDDIETLVESVRPDILVACAQRVYELSNMVEGAKVQAKKPSGVPRNESSFFSWLWPWGARHES